MGSVRGQSWNAGKEHFENITGVYSNRPRQGNTMRIVGNILIIPLAIVLLPFVLLAIGVYKLVESQPITGYEKWP